MVLTFISGDKESLWRASCVSFCQLKQLVMIILQPSFPILPFICPSSTIIPTFPFFHFYLCDITINEVLHLDFLLCYIFPCFIRQVSQNIIMSEISDTMFWNTLYICLSVECLINIELLISKALVIKHFRCYLSHL